MFAIFLAYRNSIGIILFHTPSDPPWERAVRAAEKKDSKRVANSPSYTCNTPTLSYTLTQRGEVELSAHSAPPTVCAEGLAEMWREALERGRVEACSDRPDVDDRRDVRKR